MLGKRSGYHDQADETQTAAHARQQVQGDRDRLNRLRDEFLAWWTPQRRNELRQIFDRLLSATSPRSAPHSSGRALGEGESALQRETGTAAS